MNDASRAEEDAPEKSLPSFKPFNEEQDTYIFRINLPHWRQQGGTYFLTWRLADSLPQTKLRQLDEERKLWLHAHKIEARDQVDSLSETERRDFDRRFTSVLNQWLDEGHGDCALRQSCCSQIVESALRRFDGERYFLDAFVVMPNHVHVLVTPAEGWELSKLLHSWKGFTAHEINKVLGHTGAFWQQESWDHIVRSEAQLDHYRKYIHDNPVKARLNEGEYRLDCGKGIIVKQT